MEAIPESGVLPANCLNHPYSATEFGCSRCGRPFCGNCLVSLRGRWLCGYCKLQAIQELALGTIYTDRGAAEALQMAALGIVCFGFILQPIALFRGITALRRHRGDAAWPDRWKALAAVTIAFPLTLLYTGSALVMLFGFFAAAFRA